MKSTSIILIFCSTFILQTTLGQTGAPMLAEAGEEFRPSPAETAEAAEAPAESVQLDFVVRSEFVIQRITSNPRHVDPFGLPMDPTNTVETARLAHQYDELQEATVVTNSALKNALQTLPITGIYPEKHTIVLGARIFKRGGIFGMRLEELTIRLRFEGVKGDSIYFKDLDTQEVATVEFNTRPAEFEPITSSTKAPRGEGIIPMDDLYIAN